MLWVRANTGETGNEEADTLIKQAIAKENIDMPILYSKAELKTIIKNEINKNCKMYWYNELKGWYLQLIQVMVDQGRRR